MIPDGYTSLKFVHHFADRTGFAINRGLSVDTIETVLADIQRHALTRHFNTADLRRINAEISRLWAEDINYRINVITGHDNRFSLKQIQAARIWHASGWSAEKILACLQRLDNKKIGMDQLGRLLQGENLCFDTGCAGVGGRCIFSHATISKVQTVSALLSLMWNQFKFGVQWEPNSIFLKTRYYCL